MKRTWLLAGWFLFAAFTRPVLADAPQNDPRLLVHLLDYLALDYPGAVENGKIISQLEFGEMREFIQSAIESAQNTDKIKTSAFVLSQLDTLKKTIDGKGAATEVARIARETQRAVIEIAQIEVAPKQYPSLEHGRKLYVQNCRSCHGDKGKGDGIAGVGLDPKPSNFHDAKMEDISPFQAYNTVRLGVPGTAMAAFTQFSDKEVWDLAFYVVSLRHETRSVGSIQETSETLVKKLGLSAIAAKSDNDLRPLLDAQGSEKERQLSLVRLYAASEGNALAFVSLASKKLDESLESYRKGDKGSAKNAALLAYLDGVEPIEPQLRIRDTDKTALIENQMIDVRNSIDKSESVDELAGKIAIAKATLENIGSILSRREESKTLTFTVAAGIFLREAFEASLIVITMLGVIRTMGSQMALVAVHSGWILGVLLGVVGWFFSGWVMTMSGAHREILEGVISLSAVGVLLYFGFWLHRKTEIGKWRNFINEMVNSAVSGGSLVGLGTVAFMGVFREAFETVLFLRALQLEAGPQNNLALYAGVGFSFVLVIVLSVMLVRFSSRIPIRQLFMLSSVVMVFLSTVLIGKAVHSFQETGWISITTLPFSLRADLVGIYPTYESLIPQLTILLGAIAIWLMGRKAHKATGLNTTTN